MSSTIAVEDLRVGMFIHLDGGWLSHPFPLSNFRIVSADQINTLRGLNLARVRWSVEKSDLPQTSAPAPTAPAEDPAAPAASPVETPGQQRREEWLAQREAAQRCERQHAEAARAWREASDLVRSQPQVAGRTSEQLTRAILDKILGDDDIGIRLVPGSNDRLAAHALNVTVISLLIARTMGFTEPELLDLGVGALLHDVGKSEVAERFRHAEDGCSANELAAYRDHVVKGVAIGQRMRLPAGALKVLAQHHEHADGSGFPLQVGGERIIMASRVVALVNRYDNLCNPLTRTPALTPHEAVSLLFAQGRQRFDSAVLTAFIRMMGVYPAGSLVQLTDNRYAMVVGGNSSRPLKPRVLVHDPTVSRHQALIVDLALAPDLGIRRSLPAAKLPVAAIEYLDPRPRVTYYFEPLVQPALEALVA